MAHDQEPSLLIQPIFMLCILPVKLFHCMCICISCVPSETVFILCFTNLAFSHITWFCKYTC